VPIYEYLCSKCKHRISIYVRGFNQSSPACPACGSVAMNRVFSAFSFSRSDADIYDDILSDNQLVRGLERNESKALAEWNRRISRGEKPAPEYEEMVDKLEKGESGAGISS